MRVVCGFLFTAAWALYLGGALAMELVWRPVNHHLPPAQTGVICQRMGRRYRWLALGSLAMVAATWCTWSVLGSSILLASPTVVSTPPSPAARWPLVAMLACWGSLVAVVLAMGVLLHPRSHSRGRAGADDAAHCAARRRRLRAMRLMEVLLRLELAVAIAATALIAMAGGPRIGWAA